MLLDEYFQHSSDTRTSNQALLSLLLMYYQCILTERSTQFQLHPARYSPHANTDQGVLDVKGTGSQRLGFWAPGLLMPALFNTKSERQGSAYSKHH